MVDMEELCFQVISLAGAARSKYIEAIRTAKKGDPERAAALVKEGKGFFIKGHDAHLNLAQVTEPQPQTTNLLLLHAEDQLMSAETMEIMANELIDICAMLHEKKG